MRRISRALDTIWKLADIDDEDRYFGKLPNGYDRNGDPVLSDDEFSLLNNLYHKGHSEGMHHREQMEFHQQNEDPLNAYDAEFEAKRDHDLNTAVNASIFNHPQQPKWYSYIYPGAYSQGFLDALGASGTSSRGLMYRPSNKEGNMIYDPPKKNDPWGRGTEPKRPPS